ncbi:MAG: DegT/DnrJ/EryC1/StrS family aminotransferase, partial [Deltaproteobacteria bacterium]|nr:DegT/DnrJ/EryC1/StrS family aminotransferase [Deltaproteobacteria bacterium]
FEQEFARFCSCKHGVGVASGTDALFLSLKALGIGSGDEVITVANTFGATALAILYTGARPVFVDIEQNSHLMDTNRIEKAITTKTRAIIPVHLYGRCVDMKHIMKTADAHGLYVLEDACQAHGALYDGRPAGSLGHCAAFSFYPTKNLGGLGDGGMITTNDTELYERLMLLRNYGQANRYIHDFIGYNSRLDEIQAAVLSVKLGYLEHWVNQKQQIAQRYDRAFQDINLVHPGIASESRHSYHLYVLAINRRDELQGYLKDKGIETLIHYPVPLHRQAAFKESRVPEGLPYTELRSSQILSIPIHPWLDDCESEYIIKTITEFFS